MQPGSAVNALNCSAALHRHRHLCRDITSKQSDCYASNLLQLVTKHLSPAAQCKCAMQHAACTWPIPYKTPLTMQGDLQHLSSRRIGLQVQLRPQDRRHLSIVGCLCADFDLILGDVVIQTGQKVLGEVVAAINAPVVLDELATCHFLGHLSQHNMGWMHEHMQCKCLCTLCFIDMWCSVHCRLIFATGELHPDCLGTEQQSAFEQTTAE